MKRKIRINIGVVLALALGLGVSGPAGQPAAQAAPVAARLDLASGGNPASGEVTGAYQAEAVTGDYVWHIGGPAVAVAVAGQYAYVGEGFSLTILDISAPGAPVVVGRSEFLPDIIQGVAVVGAYAYLADRESGLRVIDVSDPANPSEVGFYDTPGYASEVAAAGDYAYVADGSFGLWVIDVSDPANPTELGFYNTPGSALDVAVAGAYAYVADGSFGLWVIDVSSPASPSAVGFYDAPSSAPGVAVAGDYAYMTDGSSLVVIDVSDPTSPTGVGSTWMGAGDASYVAVAGDRAYVTGSGGLRLIDVSDPAHPTQMGYAPGGGFGVAAAGIHAYYLASGNPGGLRVIDVSDPANPSEVGFYHAPGDAQQVAVAGGYAYVTDPYNGLWVIDISDPANPIAVGFSAMPYYTYSVAVAGEYAYLAAGDNGLRVIDVSEPASPAEVGFTYTWGSPYDVAVAEDFAYVADGYGLAVIDVSDPANPSEVGWYETPEQSLGVAVAGSYAYLAGDVRLRVIDVSDPSSPSEAGLYYNSWLLGVFRDVVVAGSYAYVVGDDGLRVIDVSDPTSPTEVGVCVPPGHDGMAYGYGVALAGAYAYVAGGNNGLLVIDVSDPTSPGEAGSYATPGYAGNAAAGDYAYVADGSGGLIILDYTGLDLKERTNTTITGDAPDPSQRGLPFSVTFEVTANSGVPGGVVTVTVAGEASNWSCASALAGGTGGCEITISRAGTYTLTATYSGGDHFLPGSAVEEHTVKAGSATTILWDGPDPSLAGQPITVNFRVESVYDPSDEPNTWPSGMVTVTVAGQATSCTGTLADGTGECQITLNDPGAYTLTASYNGDDYFLPSSAVEEHAVVGEYAELSSRIYLPLSFRDYCADFFDGFGDPGSGWEISEDEFVRSEYLDGEYRVLSKNYEYFYVYSAPTCGRENYVVEVDARWVGAPGASYGIVFGIAGDYDQYYLFEVNTDYQDFGLWRFDGNDFQTIVPITGSGAINSGAATNRLKVIRDGQQITLEVNGLYLGTWIDGNISGMTGSGILSSPYEGEPTSDARFDNFSVSRLDDSTVAMGNTVYRLSSGLDHRSPGRAWRGRRAFTGGYPGAPQFP